MNYLNELNENQRKAVETTEGPVMIIAGAGSGKTRVLTYRIAHLMQKGVDPFNILSLTFTNKAAREMKERIAKIVGTNEAKNLWMGTFHSVFAKILRAEAHRLGYPQNFTIYDTDDSKGLIKDILKELGLDDKTYKPSLVLNRISSAKNMLISAKAYLDNAQIMGEDRQAAKPKIGEIYDIYTKRCFKAGAMDFDDLLFKTNILLRDFPEILHKYQHKFKYILVDEYQDTNFSQYVIVKQLAAVHENICVVGDDAQSIYAFRGANIQNILNFEKDYPDLKVFKLEQNYRSTQTIVNAANSVIANNKEQLKKNVWTSNEAGEKIKVIRTLTDNEEGKAVANAIMETQLTNRAHNKEFAILYRTNAQSRAMEEALRKLNIPYRIYGGLSFYQRKEIKDLLAYFRLAINPHDEESLKRIINYPARGIGNTTVEKLIVAASDNDISMWTAIENIEEFKLDVNAGTQTKLKEFATMIQSFGIMAQRSDAFEVANHIAQTSGILRDLYTDKTPEGVSRHENIQELLNGIKEFVEGERTTPATDLPEIESELAAPTNNEQANTNENPETLFDLVPEVDNLNTDPNLKTLAMFMQDIALLTDAESKNEKQEDRNKVSLMTIHAAKGLEFPYVFVVGLEENLFPSQLSLTSRTELEEERRLFYVALTRAEKRATLTFASTRYKWGNLTSSEPSRFIEELDPACLDFSEAAPKKSIIDDEPVYYSSEARRTTATKPKPTFTPRPTINSKKLTKVSGTAAGDYDPELLRNLQVGMSVQHERFGTGKVTNIEGAFPNNKATVEFQGVGAKQLLLKFARLKILG